MKFLVSMMHCGTDISGVLQYQLVSAGSLVQTEAVSQSWWSPLQVSQAGWLLCFPAFFSLHRSVIKMISLVTKTEDNGIHLASVQYRLPDSCGISHYIEVWLKWWALWHRQKTMASILQVFGVGCRILAAFLTTSKCDWNDQSSDVDRRQCHPSCKCSV